MKSPFRATPTFGASRARTNSPGRTALEALLISLASLFLFSPMAHADVIHVHATFTLRQAAIFPEPGGVLVYETGWSAPFVLVQPHALDRVLVHISFADADGRPQYLVLRDLGRHYLDASGFQLLNAALALDTDTGTVRARYANGWVISQSLPTVLGNLVHGTATADLPFLDGNLYANLTDGSIAIHELQVEFNFNDPANPPVFEGATGFNRVSFSARADGLTVVEMPSVTLLSGPTRNDGSAFDLDQNGTPDFGLIGIALGESQHFRYRVAAFANLAATDDDFTLSDVLGGAFTLDPDAERAATGCNDGTCDGVATVNSCSAATVLANGNIVMDPTPTNASPCVWDVFVKSAVASAKKVKGKEVVTYAPTACIVAQGPTGPLTRAIHLDDGVVLFDKTTASRMGTIISGPNAINPIELTPINCQ